MANNEIYNTKVITMPIDTTRAIVKTKAEILLEILDSPAVSVRGHREDLIRFNGDKDEPKLIWNQEALTVMDETQLRSLLTFIEKRTDDGSRKY